MRNVLWSPASVCLSAAACLHYCTDPDVTCGNGRGCPLVLHYWADLQSGHGSIAMALPYLWGGSLQLPVLRPHSRAHCATIAMAT